MFKRLKIQSWIAILLTKMFFIMAIILINVVWIIKEEMRLQEEIKLLRQSR